MENQDSSSSSSSKSPPSTPTSKDKRSKLTPAPAVARPRKPSKPNIIERRPWLRGVTIESMQKPKETTGKKVQHHTQQSDQHANNDGSFFVPKELEKMLQEKKKPHEDGWTDHQGHKELILVGLSKYPKGDWKKISKKYVKTENAQQVQEHAELVSKTHPQSSNVITYTKKGRNTIRDIAKSSSSPANNATAGAKIDGNSGYLVPVASKSSSSSPTNDANIASTSNHLVSTASKPSSSLANKARTTNCQAHITVKSSNRGLANTVSISNYVPAASDAVNYIASSSNYQVPVAAATSIASSGTNVVDQSAISMANVSEVDIPGQYPIGTLDLFPTAPPRPTLIMFPVAQPYFPFRPQIRSSGAVPDYLHGSNRFYYRLPAGTTMTITPNFSPSHCELDLDLRLG